jgi:uncharacterized protein
LQFLAIGREGYIAVMPEQAGAQFDGDALAELCRTYGIARLWVFGSTARGEAGPDSDIDLLYELIPGRCLGWEIVDLVAKLEGIFGRPVDLVSRGSIHPLVREAVLADARPLHAA